MTAEPMAIEIDNTSGLPADTAGLVRLAAFALDELRIHPDAELSIVLVDRPEMTALNEKWMDETGPTDVLSFPMDELRPPEADAERPTGLLGDIVLCPEVAQEQGERAGHGAAAELELLCVHGVLHLLGFDHAEPDEERAMFALQRDLLDKWRASRPITRSAE